MNNAFFVEVLDGQENLAKQDLGVVVVDAALLLYIAE